MRTTEIKLTKRIKIPDDIKLERYRKTPGLGPKILFFSGGSALKDISRHLIEYTHNSIHLITAFDSGGSSTKLRDAYGMLAIGDLRNRLMALADQSLKGNHEVFRLFSYRFSKDADPIELFDRLLEMSKGNNELIENIGEPMQSIICSHLMHFIEMMQKDFDLRGASIGNLVLTGGFLTNNRKIDPVIFTFSKLVEARGIVKPITYKSLHLITELENGEVLIGQHLLTGREVEPIQSPVKNIYISKKKDRPEPYQISIKPDVKKMIETADLICYPVGSFYSSVLANLLLDGVGRSISNNGCPKIYIPNTSPDKEQIGLNLFQQAQKIISTLNKNQDYLINSLLNYIVIDSKIQYPFELKLNKIKKMGIKIIDIDLISEESKPFVDPAKTNKLLLSLS
ncbi:MAG: GAK system CofD-like protein [Candidatus Zixiibacteriota bacterium]